MFLKECTLEMTIISLESPNILYIILGLFVCKFCCMCISYTRVHVTAGYIRYKTSV